MKTLFSTFLFIFIFQNVYSQQPCAPTIYSFPRDGFTITSDFNVAPTTDGGSIICGHNRDSTFHFDVYLIKVDLLGNMVWEQTYGGVEDDFGYAVHQTSDGGYIVIGSKEVIVNGNWLRSRIFLFKTNNNGIVEWEEEIGPDANKDYFGNDIKILPNGEFLIIGTVGQYNRQMIIQKLDNAGNHIQTAYICLNMITCIV